MKKSKKFIIWCLISFILGLAPGYVMTTVKVESHNMIIEKQKKEIKSLENRIEKYIEEIQKMN